MIVLRCGSPENLYFVAYRCCAWIGFYILWASIGATHLGITMQQFHNNSSVLSANQRARKLCEVLQITCSPPMWHAFLCCCDASKVWRKGCTTNRRLPNIAMLRDAFYENSATAWHWEASGVGSTCFLKLSRAFQKKCGPPEERFLRSL